MEIKILDRFSVQTRLVPALLAVLPWLAAVIAGGYGQHLKLLTGASVVGLALWISLSVVARQLGKRYERRLTKEWGVLPSVAMLRHRDNCLSEIRKQHLHARLSHLAGMAPPTPESEKFYPEQADAIYDHWSRFAVNNTRDINKFPQVQDRLRRYNFFRNLRGLRSLAFCLDLLLAFSILAWASYLRPENVVQFLLPSGIFLMALLHATLFYILVTDDAVHQEARYYAEALLDGADNIEK